MKSQVGTESHLAVTVAWLRDIFYIRSVGLASDERLTSRGATPFSVNLRDRLWPLFLFFVLTPETGTGHGNLF